MTPTTLAPIDSDEVPERRAPGTHYGDLRLRQASKRQALRKRSLKAPSLYPQPNRQKGKASGYRARTPTPCGEGQRARYIKVAAKRAAADSSAEASASGDFV